MATPRPRYQTSVARQFELVGRLSLGTFSKIIQREETFGGKPCQISLEMGAFSRCTDRSIPIWINHSPPAVAVARLSEAGDELQVSLRLDPNNSQHVDLIADGRVGLLSGISPDFLFDDHRWIDGGKVVVLSVSRVNEVSVMRFPMKPAWKSSVLLIEG